MDIKNILGKIREIEAKQILLESEDRKPAKKQEREVELPSGSKVKATKVQGWQSQKADKEADKESKKKDESVFSSSIAKALVEEFGYELNEADSAAPAQKPSMMDKVGNFFKQNAANYEKQQAANAQTEKDMADPAAQEKIKQGLTPSQLKWLGGANPADPAIRARMPAPQPGEMTGNQQAYADTVDRDDADLGAAMQANASAAQAAPAAPAAPATSDTPAAPATAAVPPGINPETGEKYDSIASAPLELPPGAEPEPGMTVAGGAKPAGGAAQPAKPAGGAAQPASGGGYTIKAGDNLTKIAKANNTTVDAIMKANPQITDPNKIAAGGKLNLPGAAPAGGAAQPAGAGAGRGGQGGPTAAELAQANAPKGQQADVRKVDNQIAANQAAKSAPPGMGQKGPTVAAAQGKDAANPLNKPAGGAAQPAAAAAPNPVTDPAGYKKYMNDRLMAAAQAKNPPPAKESVDLSRIRHLAGL